MCEEFYDNDQAAVFCLVGPATLKKSRQDGSLLGREAPKHVPIGDRKIAYKKSTLLKWLEGPDEILISRVRPELSGKCGRKSKAARKVSEAVNAESITEASTINNQTI